MSRRVLVTGSSRGIGRAIALELASAGFDVVVHGRSRGEAAEATVAGARRAGGAPSLLCFDVADREAARAALEEDIESAGPYWGVVLSAGIARDGPFPGMSGDAWDAVVGTNLGGFYNVLRPLVMPMVQARQGGRIVALSSVSGLTGNRGQVNYSAAKAGIIGATRSLALELAKRRITVNCVAPGLIETDMISGMADAVRDQVVKAIPMRRVGKPEEVAALVGFLFTDPAEYITAQVVSINGGLV